MLREIQGVRQDRPGLRRRWYQDEFFDLYTWHAADGSLVGFQVCYDLTGRERAITWHRQHGFSHNKVDGGGIDGRMSGTPLLTGDGRFPHRLVRQRFIKHAATLDAGTRKAILDKMREYGRAMARGVITMPHRKREPRNQTDPLA
jgi:hypothetical protein